LLLNVTELCNQLDREDEWMERDREDRKERRNIQETEEERRERKGERKRVDKVVAFLHICCFSILKLLLVC
jgi:hypothetical protein